MAISRLKGPVYGSKSLLCTFISAATTSNASTVLAYTNAVRVVPPYEDWFLTEMHVTCSTCTSNAAALYLKTEGGSTTIPPAIGAPGNGSTQAQTVFTITSGGSTSLSTSAIPVATPGEYEGAWVPAGSTIRIVSSGVGLIGGLKIDLMGFIRWVNSTRAES